jgi:hypothetical protein
MWIRDMWYYRGELKEEDEAKADRRSSMGWRRLAKVEGSIVVVHVKLHA